jgi:FO synthase
MCHSGDKPELRWPEAAQELRHMGFSSTLEYVEAAARAVLLETGLLPHINAGVMSQEWMSRLKVGVTAWLTGWVWW